MRVSHTVVADQFFGMWNKNSLCFLILVAYTLDSFSKYSFLSITRWALVLLLVTSCIVDSRGMSAAAGAINHQHKVKLIVVSTGPGQAEQRCRARRDAMVGTGQI